MWSLSDHGSHRHHLHHRHHSGSDSDHIQATHFTSPQSYPSHRHHSGPDSDHTQATPFTSPRSYLSQRHHRQHRHHSGLGCSYTHTSHTFHITQSYLSQGHLRDDGQHDLLGLGGVGVLPVLVQPRLQGSRGLPNRRLPYPARLVPRVAVQTQPGVDKRAQCYSHEPSQKDSVTHMNLTARTVLHVNPARGEQKDSVTHMNSAKRTQCYTHT